MGQACEWAVVRCSGGWNVISNARPLRRFDYRVDAEEEALRLAAAAQKRGEEVRVLVEDADSQMRVLNVG
ncbi:hypothetical protein [Caulobacter hibisci]|uniref:DUF2188 domain-containing protein n=1 Tax=Caulobacter hibisci TaxID=2035993 RepID=A0ABS0SZ76_9CAUL|nr:hypothetical protein [Caulobacter hibisci]MBI1684165.1 hypothetical protein [Caulobacter hibisci]